MNKRVKAILKTELIIAFIMWVFGSVIYYSMLSSNILVSLEYGFLIALVTFVCYTFEKYLEYRAEEKELFYNGCAKFWQMIDNQLNNTEKIGDKKQ